MVKETFFISEYKGTDLSTFVQQGYSPSPPEERRAPNPPQRGYDWIIYDVRCCIIHLISIFHSGAGQEPVRGRRGRLEGSQAVSARFTEPWRGNGGRKPTTRKHFLYKELAIILLCPRCEITECQFSKPLWHIFCVIQVEILFL